MVVADRLPAAFRRTAFSVGVALGAVVLLSACDLSAWVTEFVVTSTADLPDANKGDGVCEATVGVGDCTLRAAIQEANALPGIQQVTLSAVTYPLTRSGVGQANGDLDVFDDLNLHGNGAVIDASGIPGGDKVLSCIQRRTW